jgi:hypothetical protein
MAATGVDVLLVSVGSDLPYLVGYDGTNHPQAAQPFVNYPYRADELAIHVTLRRQGDGSFRAEAPSGEAFAKLTSIGGYFTNADDSLSGFAVRMSYPSAPGRVETVASDER